MKPKVENKSFEGFGSTGIKSLHLFREVFYTGRFSRHIAADFISKQLLSLFTGFHPLVKH